MIRLALQAPSTRLLASAPLEMSVAESVPSEHTTLCPQSSVYVLRGRVLSEKLHGTPE